MMGRLYTQENYFFGFGSRTMLPKTICFAGSTGCWISMPSAMSWPRFTATQVARLSIPG